ncbi:transmembrane sensor [Caulobacter rhizosphaerae]|uniref:Transmembrane sensor n=1 Tax=Caulobacter rhizosphaerae TaxID=2010972 RepID=A0ABU1MVT3_9CAUL|nr:FecR domain-containing protein [Caulobacter rhizosphaerae]MDR6530203.1 transmembrane sensor [Caulobacter rhizosphaerae]
MTRPSTSVLEQEAAAWCARLQGDMEAADWTAFTAWLELSPRHREVYDAVETFWLELDAPGAASKPSRRPIPRRAAQGAPRRARRRGGAGLAWPLGGLAAAAVVAAILLAGATASRPADYATGPGQIRTIALDDGSRVTLGPSTHLRVRLTRKTREVELLQGASAFDVAHEPSRPFEVTAGDRRVRVLGTEFDVIRRDGGAQVTVRRGLVAVADLRGGHRARLARGQQLTHRAGAQTDAISTADPDQAFGWIQGRLYYDRAPLAEVAADFSRYGARRIQVDPGAASVRVTGVFKQDDQAAMVRRLESFAPVRARFGAHVIRLQAR